MRLRFVPLLMATGLLATPGNAQAMPSLTVGGSCFATGGEVPLRGSGFTPGASIGLDGATTQTVVADAAGAFLTTLRAPFVRGAVSKKFTVTATDPAAPQSPATARFPVVRDAFFVEANLNGNPRSRIRWRFAGFPTGKPIYGHFRLHGKTRRNFRFGRATGPCGRLTVKARRLPVRKLRYGTWKLKFDHRRTYSRRTAGRLGTIRIFRRR